MAVWNAINLSYMANFHRSDAEFYKTEYEKAFEKVLACNGERLRFKAFITDGIHASPDIAAENKNGIRYISAKCIKDNEFVVDNCIFISEKQHRNNPRTKLRQNDVIITTVGTIGNVAVVDEELIPSNSDRHVGILRIHDSKALSPFYLSTFLNSGYGRFQSLREAAGNVQLNLYIRNIGNIVVPRFGIQEYEVSELTEKAYALRRSAKDSYAQAQQLLEAELGLDKLHFEKPMGYTARFSELELSRRADAEYYDPVAARIVSRITEFDHVKLGTSFSVGNGFPWNSKKFRSDNLGEPVVRIRNIKPSYIDIEELTSIEPIYTKNIGFSKASKGDVVIGMDGIKYFYASILAGDCYVNQRVAHLKLRYGAKISSEYATFVINSRIGQAQLLRDMTIATTVGHITNRDIAKLVIPYVSDHFHDKITNLVSESIDKKRQSKLYLDQAKSRVEQLIEKAV